MAHFVHLHIDTKFIPPKVNYCEKLLSFSIISYLAFIKQHDCKEVSKFVSLQNYSVTQNFKLFKAFKGLTFLSTITK